MKLMAFLMAGMASAAFGTAHACCQSCLIVNKDNDRYFEQDASRMNEAAPRGDADWRPTERWRGFNLLGMFLSRRHAEPSAADPNWTRTPGHFDEREFRWLKERYYGDWFKLREKGVFLYVGETGVYKNCPHDVALRYMEDKLRLWKAENLGWCLWNLRGTFGIVDSGRADVDYEDFEGHKLDRKFLDLLCKY